MKKTVSIQMLVNGKVSYTKVNCDSYTIKDSGFCIFKDAQGNPIFMIRSEFAVSIELAENSPN